MGRNPATGEAIQIPAKTVVKFRVAKAAMLDAKAAARTESSNEERRRTPRARLLVQVECSRGRDYVLGRSQEVSEGGLLVLTGNPFEPGSEVVVRFPLLPDPPGIFIESPEWSSTLDLASRWEPSLFN